MLLTDLPGLIYTVLAVEILILVGLVAYFVLKVKMEKRNAQKKKEAMLNNNKNEYKMVKQGA